MKLFYTDITPLNYEPPLFRSARLEERLNFKLGSRDELLSQTAGTFSTGHHAVSLKVMSIQDSTSLNQLEIKPGDQKQVDGEEEASNRPRLRVTRKATCIPDSQPMPNVSLQSAWRDAAEPVNDSVQKNRSELSKMLVNNSRPDSFVATQLAESCAIVPEPVASQQSLAYDAYLNSAKIRMQPGRQLVSKLRTRARKVPDKKSKDAVDCECGDQSQQGDMIQCDICSCWVHSVCYGFTSANDKRIPKTQLCYTCLLWKSETSLLESMRDLTLIRRALSTIWKSGFPRTMMEFSTRLNCDFQTASQITRRLQSEGYLSTPNLVRKSRISTSKNRPMAMKNRLVEGRRKVEYCNPWTRIDHLYEMVDQEQPLLNETMMPEILMPTEKPTEKCAESERVLESTDISSSDGEYDISASTPHIAKPTPRTVTTTMVSTQPQKRIRDDTTSQQARKKVSISSKSIHCVIVDDD